MALEAGMDNDVGVTDSSSNPVGARPRKAVWFVGAGILAIIVTVAISISKGRQAGDDIEFAVEPMVADFSTQTSVEQAQETNVHILAPIEQRLDVLSEWLTQRLGDLSINRKALKTDLAAIAERNKEMAETIVMLAEGGLDLGLKINEVQAQLKSIAADLQKLKEKQKPKKRRPVNGPSAPPFHIDAIDHWDNVPYVSISMNGKVSFLREGESQSGWKLIKIESATGQVTFRSPKGKTHSAFVRG